MPDSNTTISESQSVTASAMASQTEKEGLSPKSEARKEIPKNVNLSIGRKGWRSISVDVKSTLSPAPAFLEASRNSQDDITIGSANRPNPTTPKRPQLLSRGLSLQMPLADTTSSSTNLINRISLSPQIESSMPYGTTVSVLPRSMRGQDFSRFASNLHHSTIADRSSPESSPVIGGRAMNIPRRGHGFTSVSDLPGLGWSTNWNSEKPSISSSLGSGVNMLDSSSDSDSSDYDQMRMEEDDTIHMTPQPSRTIFPLAHSSVPAVFSPGTDLGSPFQTAAGSLRNFQQRIRQSRRGRRHEHGLRHSPGPPSPPLQRSIEPNSGVPIFPPELSKLRRESLSLGTHNMHLSTPSSNDDSDSLREANIDQHGISIPLVNQLDERRNVIRRAVTGKRSNMLVSIIVSIFLNYMLILYSPSQKALLVFVQRYWKRVVH